MAEGKRVTLRVLAEILGMTPAAVSKALSGKNDISEETQKKVRKLADEMGYRPNLIARGLVNKRSGLIGIMISDLRISYFAEVVRGTYERARQLNFTPILMINEENRELERKNLEILASIQVDGIVLHPTPGNHNINVFNQLQSEGIKMVSYDRYISNTNITSVTIDDVKAGYAITEALIKDGCKNFQFIGFDPNLQLTVDRLEGMKGALQKHNIEFDQHKVVECQLDFEIAYEKAKDMLTHVQGVDAIICMGGLVAHATARAGMDLNRVISKDFKIAEFGNNNVLHRLGVPFFTVDQSPLEIGHTAVDKLVAQINEEGVTPVEHIKIPSKIIEYNRDQEARVLQIVN